MADTLTAINPQFNRSNTSSPGVHGAFVLCGISAILLPAHPSLQFMFLSYGVSPALISAIFVMPLLFLVITKRLLTKGMLGFVILMLLYLCWMLLRGIDSPALGLSNFFQSLRSIVVLVPLSMFCSFIASRNPSVSAKYIFVLSVVAALHFITLLIGGGLFEVTGFRSLSGDDERHNYQSTSFYFGFSGLAFACMALRSTGVIPFIGIIGFLFITFLMAMVGARSSIVALAVSVLTVLALTRLYGLSRLLFFSLPISFFLIVMTWAVGVFDVDDLQSNLTIIERFLVLYEGDDPSYRLYLFASAFLMWTDSVKNFLIGGGLGAFPGFIGEVEEGWYPHNFLLESLAEGGLIAGLLLSSILFLTARYFFRLTHRGGSLEEIYLGALAIYAVIAYQFMGGVQTLWIPMFFISLFIFYSSRSEV